jgi:GT2 family glycosyltransferase
MSVEFVNPNNHEVHLRGPDNHVHTLLKGERRVMEDYFKRYVPRYLKILKEGVVVQVQQHQLRQPNRQVSVKTKTPIKIHQGGYKSPQRPIVGRAGMYSQQASEYYNKLIREVVYPISNDIGVGILSYNRLPALHRLLMSIRAHTDLTKTTVFVSDESSSPEIKEYLSKIPDMVVLNAQPRVGIAGNTNRLLRCLSRFRYKLLLNDDVEVLQPRWDDFYFGYMSLMGMHHLCFRMPGVYGATNNDGVIQKISNISIRTITEKPHGAVMAFDDFAFKKVGYFDESFGVYGMEHVDWSERVSKSGIQLPGFHDLVGSEKYFRIYSETSAVAERGAALANARKKYSELSHKPDRIFVSPTDTSKVPCVSYIIPYCGIERISCIKMVIQNIKAQAFPEIDIVGVEQDEKQKINFNELSTITSVHALPHRPGDPFTKSIAFNLGVRNAKYNKLFLHDADMLVPGNYTTRVAAMLDIQNGVHIGKNVIYLNNESTKGIMTTQKVIPGFLVDRTVAYFEGGTLACTRTAFLQVGGFNEDFIGYGNEDTEFFYRLSKVLPFNNVRTEDLIHLWHGRSLGWMEWHKRNKAIEKACQAMDVNALMAVLRTKLYNKYKF